MYTKPQHPDAHHRVKAPGGYEWWYVDAASSDSRTHVVAILFDGYCFHPGYLRTHARFLRRPTKTNPALPSDYPCAYLAVYRDGKLHRQFLTQVPPDQFEASTTEPRVRVGRSSLVPTGDGLRLFMAGTPWTLTARGPQLIEKESLGCDLTLTPTPAVVPEERIFLSRGMTGQHHGWIPAAPRCAVRGTVAGEAFDGVAYHDHNYGTGPLGDGLRRWVWGRVFTKSRLLSFHLAEPRDEHLPTERHAYEVTDNGYANVPAEALAADWSARSATRLPYPNTIRLGDALELTQPRMLDDSPFYLRVLYDAWCDGETNEAMVEVGHPHRLRYPILGRMLEMAIDKRSLC